MSVQKGDLITMNLDGTDRLYRVLKINGTNAKVFAMFDAENILLGKNTNVNYSKNQLDEYMEETWYNSLTDTVKEAIKEDTIYQYRWYIWTSSDDDLCYYGTYKYSTSTKGNYGIKLGDSIFYAAMQRHVYTLSIQEIFDYLEVTLDMTAENTTLTYDNIRTMVWNNTTTSDGGIWLRSTEAVNLTSIACIKGNFGAIMTSDVSTNSASNDTFAMRPTFTIDLSKINAYDSDNNLITFTKTLTLTLNSHISSISYKTDSTNWTTITSSTSVSIPTSSTVYCYATPASGYSIQNGYSASVPYTFTMTVDTTYSPIARIISNKLYNSDYITNIANAIRSISSSSTTYKVSEMAAAILNFEAEAHGATISGTAESSLYGGTASLILNGNTIKTASISSTGVFTFSNILTIGDYTISSGDISITKTITAQNIIGKEKVNIALI